MELRVVSLAARRREGEEGVVCFCTGGRKEGKVVATHGGLECGIFQKRMPGVDMVTMSCNSEGAHSPEEHMELDSFARTYDLLKAVLQKLCQ